MTSQAGPALSEAFSGAPLEVGDRAPAFALPDQHGQRFDSATLHGSPAVVVFYPSAFTGVCTAEMCALRDNLGAFGQVGARVVAVSTDTMFALRVFADTEHLTFPLLSDFWPHGATAQAFGVFDDEFGCARRASFVLDADGRITWRVVNAMGDARDIAEHLRAVSPGH